MSLCHELLLVTVFEMLLCFHVYGMLTTLLAASTVLSRAELHGGAEQMLLEEAKLSHFTPVEKEFFDDYSISDLIDDEQSYYFSRQKLGLLNGNEEQESYTIRAVCHTTTI